MSDRQSKDRLVIYKTENFSVIVPNLPHITRDEGGHIFVEPNDKTIENRWDMPMNEIQELAWVCAVAARAYKEVMIEQGVPIYRLNLQDNGNWSFIDKCPPTLHVHIYGRSDNEKNEGSAQRYGQALVFPWRDTGFYDNFKPIANEEIILIAKRMAEISREGKFAANAPKCTYNAAIDGQCHSIQVEGKTMTTVAFCEWGQGEDYQEVFLEVRDRIEKTMGGGAERLRLASLSTIPSRLQRNGTRGQSVPKCSHILPMTVKARSARHNRLIAA